MYCCTTMVHYALTHACLHLSVSLSPISVITCHPASLHTCLPSLEGECISCTFGKRERGRAESKQSSRCRPPRCNVNSPKASSFFLLLLPSFSPSFSKHPLKADDEMAEATQEEEKKKRRRRRRRRRRLDCKIPVLIGSTSVAPETPKERKGEGVIWKTDPCDKTFVSQQKKNTLFFFAGAARPVSAEVKEKICQQLVSHFYSSFLYLMQGGKKVSFFFFFFF